MYAVTVSCILLSAKGMGNTHNLQAEMQNSISIGHLQVYTRTWVYRKTNNKI